MSLRWVGPVELGDLDHGDPEFSWTAGQSEWPTASITGKVPWATAHQLRELCDNPARLITVGSATGVLEPIVFDDDLLRPFNGSFLLGRCQLGQADYTDSLSPLVPISLPVVHLGDREIVVYRTERAKETDFATIAAEPLVMDLYYGSWLITPSGVSVDREIDTTFPHQTAPLSIPASDGGVGGGGLLPASSLFPSSSLFPAT